MEGTRFCGELSTADASTDVSTTEEPTASVAPAVTVGERTVRVAELSVADYIVYPLAGTHPHVHRECGTQYVVVRVETSVEGDDVQKRLSLSLDGEAVSLADHQPVPWSNSETVDVAFALSKDRTVDSGRLLFDDREILTLSPSVRTQVNNPPAFEVTDLSVTPTEIGHGEQRYANVSIGVANRGRGPGIFGASLSGNYSSGFQTMSEPVEAGEESVAAGTVTVLGQGDEASLSADWGHGGWSTAVPVVGTPTEQ